MKRLGALAFALLVVGCGGQSTPRRVAADAPVRSSPSCPAAWRAGWQRLAERIGAPVYCPTWMPNPLDGRIGGRWTDIDSVARDRSYLISFLWHEAAGGDVHVNFRGYPGRTAIPRCVDVEVNGTTTRRTKVPCFSDPRGGLRANGIDATLYTVNQDADQWHILYAWRRGGSLYSVSEHVTPPLTYRNVRRNLDRLLHGLVLIRPRGA
jgi:hypothetical protein